MMTFNTFMCAHVHSAHVSLNCEPLNLTLTLLTPAFSTFLILSCLSISFFPSSQSREEKGCSIFLHPV